MNRLHWRNAAFFCVALLVCGYYRWGVRAAGHEFDWSGEKPGYYNFLARAFVSGHTYLEIEPRKELLAQANPWSPAVPDELKLFDAVLYNRRYYIYHGPGPAILLFAPWRFVTKRDLPENFALFLMCFGGWVFSALAMRRLVRLAGVSTGPVLELLLLLALGFCQGVPFLLNRVWVYEIAIGGGFFFVSGGVYFLARAWESDFRSDLALAGLFFGAAISCRPHLGLLGVLVLLQLFRKLGLRAIPFAITFAVAGLLVCGYNFARFEDPFEFGTNYLLGGAYQSAVRPKLENLVPGLYYLLGCEPEFSKVFPWVRSIARIAPGGVPRHYTLEPMVGGLWMAPFAIFLPLVAITGRARRILVIILAHVAGILLFLASTGWSVPRYQVDFLPLVVLVSCVAVAVASTRMPSFFRRTLTALLAASVVFGTAVNLALGVAGPINEMLIEKPARYARIAAWFSPVEAYRPRLNPPFHATFQIRKRPERQILLLAGVPSLPYQLVLEPSGLLVSSFGGHDQTFPVQSMDDEPTHCDVAFEASSGEIQVRMAGQLALRHRIGTMVSIPPMVFPPGH